MARRPPPRILTTAAPLSRGREIARTAADHVTEMFHPLLVLSRGLRRLVHAGRRRWAGTPQERRGEALFLGAGCVLLIALAPFGPPLAVLALLTAAVWAGRDRPPAETGPGEAETARLRVLYEALVPCFSFPDDPDPLYTHGGDWQRAVLGHACDEDGRPVRLELRYPPYFPDGDPGSRARVEQLLHAKCGRGREYLFVWDEEANRLTVTALDPLPTDIRAQRFVTSPGETVLGFTDADGVPRTVPVTAPDGSVRDAPPVLWRTGPRSTEPHLIALGRPGSGMSTLLRSLTLQALPHGDVLLVDGGGTGEYAFLAGRRGVLAVECDLPGALATLEWAAHETERRLLSVHRARQLGRPAPDDTRRRLWIVLDRPTVLGHLAAVEGRPDPQEFLRVPLRHGRAANVTVVVADQFDTAELLSEEVRTHTRARVVLGPASPGQLRAVLGTEPHTTPPSDVPPGRGYVRLGPGPVHRLQVPATPDPYDEETGEADREDILALCPERPYPAEADA